MNAVEIEEAVSELVSQPFDSAEFPFQFLAAFGAKDTTLKRLRKGESNASDVLDGVLQRNNIHIAVARTGEVSAMLASLRTSPKTASAKAKFLIATDGETVEAEDLLSGDVIACAYRDLPRHFAAFLPLAGISTVKELKNNPIDVKATGRLNRLYVELLKDNPDWATEEKRPQLNQFMAQLIFCFFAEDTDIFHGTYKFTPTVERMTSGQADNTQAVIAELFRAMGTRPEDRAAGRFPTWANGFPYVNGGYLFSGATECPRFSRTARAYLLRAGELDWKEINPDIFGSMIQAVADDGERGELGMHYTSVPNILKVLNPLFLDDLREQLGAAGDSRQRLRNLRKRLANIRVFDPACGSGNFLVIAYKEMRAIEAEIVRRLGGETNLKLEDRRSVIPLSNFYGIEIKGFAAEIARLSLLIAEFQADCLYLSQQEARSMVLPLHKTGQINVGNALRLDWFKVCPPQAKGPMIEHDRTGPNDHVAMAMLPIGEGVTFETYVCGNPPYVGGKKLDDDQKADMKQLFKGEEKYKNLDYICGFIVKLAEFLQHADRGAFVSTNSVSQGTHVPVLWPIVLRAGCQIVFSYNTFKWRNNAQNNAGVSCTIIGLSRFVDCARYIYDGTARRQVRNINAYLVEGENIIVIGRSTPGNSMSQMITGNAAYDEGNLFLSSEDARELLSAHPRAADLIRPVSGTSEFIDGVSRYCLWIEDKDLSNARSIPDIAKRIDRVVRYRENGGEVAVTLADRPHQFRYRNTATNGQILVPQVSSERREYLPVGFLPPSVIITHLAHAIYRPTMVDLAVLVSRIHLVWVTVICGKLETRIRYASNLGWNTFPVPKLTERNKADLTRTAENIMLSREAHFPATIAELYDPGAMPEDLRRAHE